MQVSRVTAIGMPARPGQAIVLGDDDHVTGAQLLEEFVELGPLPGRAADLVCKNPFGTGVGLGVEVLVVRGDAGISNDHTPRCQKRPKRSKILGWGFVPFKCLISGGAGQRA